MPLPDDMHYKKPGVHTKAQREKTWNKVWEDWIKENEGRKDLDAGDVMEQLDKMMGDYGLYGN